VSEKVSFSIPKPNIPSIIEGAIDFLIIATTFHLASSFLLADGVEIQAQPFAFVAVLGVTGIAVKWALGTKIWAK
jgi:hypothetical protein